MELSWNPECIAIAPPENLAQHSALPVAV